MSHREKYGTIRLLNELQRFHKLHGGRDSLGAGRQDHGRIADLRFEISKRG